MELSKKAIGERLNRVLTDLKLSKQIDSIQALASDCKMSPSAISEMTSGRNHVSQRFMECLENMFKVNPDYILKGEGPMFGNGQRFDLPEKPIVLFDEFAYFGDPGIFEDYSSPGVRSFVYDPEFKDCQFGIVISTDVMSPAYGIGDKLLLKQLNDYDLVQFGKPYVILTSEVLLFRYINKNQPGMWTLKAAGKQYDDIEFRIEKAIGLYQVKGCIHRVS